MQTTGTVRVLVLLVDFQDVPPAAAHTGAYFDSFYNNASAGAKSFRAYYSEVSLGALTVQATVIPTWFHSAHPMSYYGADGSRDRKSTRLNSSHQIISYAVFCLKKKITTSPDFGHAPATRVSGLKTESPLAIEKPRFGAPP